MRVPEPFSGTIIRRLVLLGVFGAGLLACNPLAPDAEEADAVLARLLEQSEARVVEELNEGRPRRADGFTYAIDLINTMRAAARMDNRSLFDRAYEMIDTHFLRTSTDDEAARYTVLWRYAPDHPPDASGSKETGALAGALWQAYAQWGERGHREVALQVLDAYLRHGSWETDDRFLVKNYYNYRTRTLSENTWLLNQMPHTIRRIGCATRDSTLLRFADGMARFTKGAALKDGFFHEMYDRGISTVIEGADGYYSPNGILKLQSSLEIARALRPFDATPAQKLLQVLDESDRDLYTHYYYNPRAGTLRPLWTTPDTEYWLSEQALFLDLATSLRGEVGTPFLRAFVQNEIVPSLRKWGGYVALVELIKGRPPSAFYYELPLMMEAIYKYLHPEDARISSGESSCQAWAGP